MDAPRRSGRLRSFALGGLVGAAGAIATGRRLTRARSRIGPGGLAAFEDAPCFLELAAQETQRVRDEGAGAPPDGGE